MHIYVCVTDCVQCSQELEEVGRPLEAGIIGNWKLLGIKYVSQGIISLA